LETTLKDIRKKVAKALEDQGFENAIDEAKWLLAYVLGRDSSYITLNGDETFPEELTPKLQETLQRRLRHEPLSRIRGCREFWSLEFDLNAHTLDPRPDSEILIEGVLSKIMSHPCGGEDPKNKHYRILDLGTGTGCLLISLLKELPQAYGIGGDYSFEALQMARHNAEKLGVGERASFYQGCWSEALSGPFDIIVSNPPYIPYHDKEALAPEVSEFDPTLALYGGEDGYDCYRELAQDLFRVLAPHGLIALELGQGQRCEVQSIFQNMGYLMLDVIRDLQGIERVIIFSCENRKKGRLSLPFILSCGCKLCAGSTRSTNFILLDVNRVIFIFVHSSAVGPNQLPIRAFTITGHTDCFKNRFMTDNVFFHEINCRSFSRYCFNMMIRRMLTTEKHTHCVA